MVGWNPLALFQYSGWIGEIDPDMVYPKEFDVDYVRIYQRESNIGCPISTRTRSRLTAAMQGSSGIEHNHVVSFYGFRHRYC
ncbi:MAG: hypothetical protein GX561_00730 [Lentisphaerae bacterium]|jgi:hypothetical protein|nr:hypothetical protein [Lentisphaerota bacterium]